MNYLGDTTTPMIVRMGILYNTTDIITALDIVNKYDNIRVNVGGEMKLLNQNLSVRIGLGVGTNEYLSTAFGFGYKYGLLCFDYGFSYPILGIKNTFGTHNLSIKIMVDTQQITRDQNKSSITTKQVFKPKTKTYIVKEGDTLPLISEKVYKDRIRWREIYNANKENINPTYDLTPGQELVIP